MGTNLMSRMLAVLPAGDWIDLGCLLILLICVGVGIVRGISGKLAGLFGLLTAVVLGFWLYPGSAAAMSRLAFCREHAWAGSVLPYLLVVVGTLVVFLLLRLFLSRFFKLIVEQPADWIFGLLVGVAQGLLLLAAIFSAASLIPKDHPARQAFCVQSRVGRAAAPVLEVVLREHVNLQGKKRPAAAPRPKGAPPRAAAPARPPRVTSGNVRAATNAPPRSRPR